MTGGENSAAADVPSGQYDWVIPMRLGASTSPPATMWEDLRLLDVIESVKWCYHVRNVGRTLAPDGVRVEASDAWLRVALGLAGSIAESLAVCAACEVEIESLRAVADPSGEIGGRFFSIASSQEIIGVGHRLANLVQRAISARPEYRALLRSSSDRQLAACANVDDPRSTARAAWLSLNADTVRAMVDALRGVSHPSIKSALTELAALVRSDQWVNLTETRGEVFHRSRPESSIAAGLDGRSGFVSPIIDPAGVAIGYSVGRLTRYSEGDDRWVKETAVSRAALDRVAVAARLITSAVVKALEPLTRGRRFTTINDDTGRIQDHQRIGGQWAEEACSCCANQIDAGVDPA